MWRKGKEWSEGDGGSDEGRGGSQESGGREGNGVKMEGMKGGVR